jgi:hypothetical protein
LSGRFIYHGADDGPGQKTDAEQRPIAVAAIGAAVMMVMVGMMITIAAVIVVSWARHNGWCRGKKVKRQGKYNAYRFFHWGPPVKGGKYRRKDFTAPTTIIPTL